MQQNIAMKFAEYVAWILLCKRTRFGEKLTTNSRDIEFSPRVLLFLARPVYCRLLYSDGTYYHPFIFHSLSVSSRKWTRCYSDAGENKKERNECYWHILVGRHQSREWVVRRYGDDT